MTVCSCGAEIAGQGSEAVLCPACLIAETVERDKDVDDELRYLLRVVGRQN